MSPSEARTLNNAAYRRLKSHIDAVYPKGHFVAIVDGDIFADSLSFDDLHALTKPVKDAERNVLVVQSGMELPESVVILKIGPTK